MKIIVSLNNSRIKGYKNQMVPNVSITFDINLKARQQVKIDDLSFKGRSNVICKE